MSVTIRRRNGSEIATVEAETVCEALAELVMGGVSLEGATLSGADLRNADLTLANLRNADLTLADLRNADLTLAKLSDAKLGDSDLHGAILSGATMPCGETWEQYREEVVPALLTYGGKTVAEVLATGCWECHEWSNCPMHSALGIGSVDHAPLLIRPRVTEFVQYFDAGLIPKPKVEGAA